MKVKVDPKRALMWGAMFVVAYFGGSWLGRFVVAGVDTSAASPLTALGPEIDGSNEVVNRAEIVKPPIRTVDSGGLANHVCTGCDAGETRYRQMAQQMGLPAYEEDTVEHDDAGAAPAGGQAESFAED